MAISAIATAAGVFLHVTYKSPEKVPRPTLNPIPEFARTARVILPIELFQFSYHADQLSNAIREAGAAVEIVGKTSETLEGETRPTMDVDHTNIWLRDYSPIAVRSDQKTWLRGFHSDSPDLENNNYAELVARTLGMDYKATDLRLDGGNFLTDGRLCFMAGAITGDEHPMELPSQEEMRQGFGCEQLIVIEEPPHVHVDMFAKVLAPGVVAVNQLEDEVARLIQEPDGDLADNVVELIQSLDNAAAQFAKYMKVVRLPMPLPYKNSFRTFANAILVNGSAIIPSYQQYGWGYGSYPDEVLLSDMHRRAARVYEDAGFRTVFVNADGLIYNGGAFHCVSAHVPESVLTISRKGNH